jgi:hypothetical protein
MRGEIDFLPVTITYCSRVGSLTHHTCIQRAETRLVGTATVGRLRGYQTCKQFKSATPLDARCRSFEPISVLVAQTHAGATGQGASRNVSLYLDIPHTQHRAAIWERRDDVDAF